MPSVQQSLKDINSILKGSIDGPYSHYSCDIVSWNDIQSGAVGGWGSNITDTRICAKDGHEVFTVRGNNWNERLGKVTANDLSLIATEEKGGTGPSHGLPHPVTLRTVLAEVSKFGKYANINVDSLYDKNLDENISVRFQTTFVSVETQAVEFSLEAYNYSTMNDENPRNLIFLCTPQGLSIEQDGRDTKRLFHHSRAGKTVRRCWLEVESSSHNIGDSRGEAASAVIGTRATRLKSNILMTIQIPLEQKQNIAKPPTAPKSTEHDSANTSPESPSDSAYSIYNHYNSALKNLAPYSRHFNASSCSLVSNSYSTSKSANDYLHLYAPNSSMAVNCPTSSGYFPSKPSYNPTSLLVLPLSGSTYNQTSPAYSLLRPAYGHNRPVYSPPRPVRTPCPTSENSSPLTQTVNPRKRRKCGSSSAATVSRSTGSVHDYDWEGLSVKEPKRHKSDRIAATIVIYYTFSGSVPSTEDVKSAIDELEHLYQATQVNRKLECTKSLQSKRPKRIIVKNTLGAKKNNLASLLRMMR